MQFTIWGKGVDRAVVVIDYGKFIQTVVDFKRITTVIIMVI